MNITNKVFNELKEYKQDCERYAEDMVDFNKALETNKMLYELYSFMYTKEDKIKFKIQDYISDKKFDIYKKYKVCVDLWEATDEYLKEKAKEIVLKNNEFTFSKTINRTETIYKYYKLNQNDYDNFEKLCEVLKGWFEDYKIYNVDINYRTPLRFNLTRTYETVKIKFFKGNTLEMRIIY